MDASCIKGKFQKITRLERLHVLTSCKNWSHWRWTKISSATTGNLITRSLPPWFTVKRDLSTIHPTQSHKCCLTYGADEPILKSVQNKYFKEKSTWLWRKESIPTFFRVLLHIFAHYFCFEKLVHRNRDWDISISALGCVLEGKKGRMTVAHWERERKASKCLNNYLQAAEWLPRLTPYQAFTVQIRVFVLFFMCGFPEEI